MLRAPFDDLAAMRDVFVRYGLFSKRREDSLEVVDPSEHHPININVSYIGSAMIITSLLMASISVLNSMKTNPSWDLENDDHTRFIIENEKEIRNGTFVYPTDGKYDVVSTGIIDSWLRNIRAGMERYNFGNSRNNFCWRRKTIPEDETMHSLFRASQLSAGVQVPIRVMVLATFPLRLIVLWSSLHLHAMQAPSVSTSVILLSIINETAHLSGFLMMFAIHLWQDIQYAHAFGFATALTMVTFVIKMFLLSAVKGRCPTTIARMGLAIVAISIGRAIAENEKKFLELITCDQMVPSSVAISEYLFVLMMIANYALDHVDGRSLSFVVHCVAEEDPRQKIQIAIE